MKRTVTCLFCALLLLAFCLSSCAPSMEGHPLIGRWEIAVEVGENVATTPLVFHFKEDGNLYLEQRDGDEIAFSLLSGSFKVEEDRVTLSMDGNYDTFTFSVSDSRLTLSREGQEDLIFSRVESKNN